MNCRADKATTNARRLAEQSTAGRDFVNPQSGYAVCSFVILIASAKLARLTKYLVDVWATIVPDRLLEPSGIIERSPKGVCENERNEMPIQISGRMSSE